MSDNGQPRKPATAATHRADQAANLGTASLGDLIIQTLNFTQWEDELIYDELENGQTPWTFTSPTEDPTA